MLNIGCHLSVSKGYLAMGKTAREIGGNTFQYFTRNPRGGKAKALNLEDIAALRDFMQEHGFAPILGHAPYTLNACSQDPKIREFALMVMTDDLANLEHLPGNYYNFHPGSHGGQGLETGLNQIAELLNQVLNPDFQGKVLLETMSGKGSEVGGCFEELHAIIERTRYTDNLGICLDTCHVYSAGYDLVERLDGVLEEFDRVIGLKRLYAIHLNDSMTPLGSKKDRHAKIGEGTLGIAAIERIVNHPQLKGLPFYLETPNELDGYAKEIQLLKELAGE